jgi:hypothetical protein
MKVVLWDVSAHLQSFRSYCQSFVLAALLDSATRSAGQWVRLSPAHLNLGACPSGSFATAARSLRETLFTRAATLCQSGKHATVFLFQRHFFTAGGPPRSLGGPFIRFSRKA